MKVLVIGETCIDKFVFCKCVRLAPDQPVPVIQPISSTESAGMAGNVAENIRKLGVEADLFTNKNFREIKKVRFIDDNSGHMFVRVDENDHLFEEAKINNDDTLDELYEKIDQYSAVVISDYHKNFMTETFINEVATYASYKGIPVFLDTKRLLGWFAKNVSFIKINENEYQKTKDYLTKEIEDKLIITSGKKGASFQGKDFPVQLVEIKEVSGAGDAFISGLVVEYIKTQDVERSIIFANEVATHKVQKKGTGL